MRILIGVLIGAIAIIFLLAVSPAIEQLTQGPKGCQNFNCPSWVDKDSSGASCSATNTTYVSSLDTNTLGCTLISLVTPLLIIGVVIGVIVLIMYGQPTSPTPVSYEYGSY